MANQPTQEAPSSDVVEMVASIRYTAACIDAHADKFPVPEHMRIKADELRKAAAALASTAGDTLKAELDAVKAELDRQYDENVSLIVENERLRAALERAEQDLSCRDGNGHYCPNCDRSGFDTLQAIRAALGSDQ